MKIIIHDVSIEIWAMIANSIAKDYGARIEYNKRIDKIEYSGRGKDFLPILKDVQDLFK